VREREQQVHGDHAVEAELAVFAVDCRIGERLVVACASVIEARGVTRERHGAPFGTEAEEFELAGVEVPAEAEGGRDANATFELERAGTSGDGLAFVVLAASFAFLHADERSSSEEADVGIGGKGAEEREFAAERNDVDLRSGNELDATELIVDQFACGVSRRAGDARTRQVNGGEVARGKDVGGGGRANAVVDRFDLEFVGKRRRGRDAVRAPDAEAEPVGRMPTDAKPRKDRALVFVEQGE